MTITNKEIGLPYTCYRVRVLTDTRVELRTNNETNIVNYVAGVHSFKRQKDAEQFRTMLAARYVPHYYIGKYHSALAQPLFVQHKQGV